MRRFNQPAKHGMFENRRMLKLYLFLCLFYEFFFPAVLLAIIALICNLTSKSLLLRLGSSLPQVHQSVQRAHLVRTRQVI